MATINLTQGKSAVIDDCDVHLGNWKWFLDNSGPGYAGRNVVRPDGKRRTMYLHHAVIGFPLNGKEVDHIDGNGLNNSRGNLRIVTRRGNTQNRKCHRSGNKSSKYVGVYFDKRDGSYNVRAWIGKVKKHIGRFKSEEDASRAYQAAVQGT